MTVSFVDAFPNLRPGTNGQNARAFRPIECIVCPLSLTKQSYRDSALSLVREPANQSLPSWTSFSTSHLRLVRRSIRSCGSGAAFDISPPPTNWRFRRLQDFVLTPLIFLDTSSASSRSRGSLLRPLNRHFFSDPIPIVCAVSRLSCGVSGIPHANSICGL